MSRKYATFNSGEYHDLVKSDYNNGHYPNRAWGYLVLEEGNPSTNGFTKAWVRVQRVNRNSFEYTRNNSYWTYKRFFNPEKFYPVDYDQDRVADEQEDLL